MEPGHCLVHATAVRWVADEPFPGMVEVPFAKDDGDIVVIHEKCSVIDVHLDRATNYPVEVWLPAECIAVTTSARAVRLLHGVWDLKDRTDSPTVGSRSTVPNLRKRHGRRQAAGLPNC
jgi:hypothetical protein